MADSNSIVMEIVTDPAEIAKAKAIREQADRNYAWWQANAAKMFSDENRGKCVCISGGELFVAETVEAAVEMARTAHPQDEGRVVHYIPKERVPRIYAN
jgi:hypothetical protein